LKYAHTDLQYAPDYQCMKYPGFSTVHTLAYF